LAKLYFQDLLPVDGEEFYNVVLKYRHMETIPPSTHPWSSWVGMSAMIESDELWNRTIKGMGCDSPTLGVFLEKKEPVAQVEGMPVVIYLRTGPLDMDRHPVPPTFQVRLMERTSIFC